MARLGMAGAETGGLTGDALAATSGTVGVVGSPVRSGARAYSIDATTDNAFKIEWTGVTGRWFYSRFWFRLTQLPTSAFVMAETRVFSDGAQAEVVYVLPSGKLSRMESGAPTSATFAVDEWNCLEIGVKTDPGSAFSMKLRLNGVEFEDLVSSANVVDAIRFGTPQFGSFGLGTIYVDDIAWNDDTGSADNSWPGVSGHVVLLTPDTDEAVGRDWVGGAPVAAGDYPAAVAADTPTGYWKLDNTSGSTSTATVGSNGTITGGTSNTMPIVGDGGVAWENTAAVANQITFPISIGASANFSLETWWRYYGPGTAGANLVILRDNTATGLGTAGAKVDTTTPSNPVQFRIAGTTITTSTPSSALLDGKPHHIVLTRNGSTGKLYLDGVEIGSGTIGTAALTTPLSIGKDGSSATYHNAKWDHVSTYSAALSAARVLAHYNAGLSPANAWQAVNNIPPVGVANGTAGWESKQIRDQVGSVAAPNADADFRTPAYSTVVPAGGTVRCVQAVANLGVSTSATLSIELGLVANPPETRVTVTAFGVAGTYPTSWRYARSTGVSDPAVALSDRPVVRVGKRTASTAALLCCLLGVYVEYTPPPTPIYPGGVASSEVAGGADLSSLIGIPPGGVPATGGAGGAIVAAAVAPTGLAVGGVAPTGEAGPFLATAPLMPHVTDDFQNTWQSGVQIGVDRPTMLVQVRTGRFWRRNARWMGQEPVGVSIYGTDNNRPWQPFWTAEPPNEAYSAIPNVRSVNFEQSLDQNGITSATVVIDNIFYKPEAAGYHSIKRGYMAPLRGFTAPGQTPVVDEQGETVAQNEWFGLLSRESQILIKQGYGTADVKTFTGLIDDVDTTSRPDVITITARDFGKVLNDERVFGWNKEPKVKDPVIFIDADQADDIDLVGSNAASSSNYSSRYGPENVLDGDGDSSWISNTHTIQDFTEYVEIRLPQGRYNDFRVSFGDVSDYEMYVSMNPKDLADNSAPTWAGVAVTENQWIDGGSGEDVPGGNGGHKYLRKIAVTPTGSNHVYKLHPDGTDFKVGNNTLLRLSFRNLNLAALGPTPFGALVVAFKARKRTLLPEAKTQRWVRCDDVSDVVRQILRWAGFKEWEVDQTGVGLPKRFVVNRGMTYMEVIQKMKDLTGFTFFMADPTNRENSIGVPVFRKSLIVTDAAPVLTLDDRSLLAAVDVKQSDESLAYIIRTRGRASSNGQRLGGDAEERLMFTFRPPWGYNLQTLVLDKLGGIIKHVIHTDDMYKTMDDVKFAAYYIALQEALASIQASIQINAHPGPQLDDHVALTDLGTGVTSRLSVQSRSTSFERTADGTKWVTTLGGALVDEPDVTSMVAIMEAARRH